jgi:hypothetical protein
MFQWFRRTPQTTTRLRLLETPAADVAREHIQRYTGQDIIGRLAKGQLTVDDVANLADTKAWIAEQREVLEYAAKHLEQIFDDVAEIEGHLKTIITKGLKSKEQVNKYLKDVMIAGQKHENSIAVLNAELVNEEKHLEAERYGDLSLAARKAKNKLLLLQADFTAREDELDGSYDLALKERDLRQEEAERKRKRRLLLSRGYNAVDNTQVRGQGWGILRTAKTLFGFGR